MSYLIPFDLRTGNMFQSIEWSGYNTPSYVLEKENYVFTAELEFMQVRKNWITLRDKNTNLIYCMFLTTLEKHFNEFDKGIIKGQFTFQKKGQSFGIKWIS